MSADRKFLLTVITRPDFFPGEAELLEGLLSAGLEKLHIRKPAASRGELEGLIRALPARWHDRLVLHSSGGRGRADGVGDAGAAEGSAEVVSAYELALAYFIPQIHGPVGFADGGDMSGGGGPAVAWNKDRRLIGGVPMALSTSVHSHEELNRLPPGLAYAFVSPLYDSISKPGYLAESSLLLRPAGPFPCRAVGLGGIGVHNLREVIEYGWDGAAVLGWIWEEPAEAVSRFRELQSKVKS